MHVKALAIPEVLLLTPRVSGDERGFFFESLRKRRFGELFCVSAAFVQENHSKSIRGVLRGLHYQLPPYDQAKLVREDEVFDVAVDNRGGSSTFGCWVGARLSASNHHQLWVPAGFANGFLILTATAEFLYTTTDYYAPESERSIRWDDPEIEIEIDWPIDGPPQPAARDAAAPESSGR
jgi:dTDP-4-dehydrorhamnose 3,5-epimerase